MEIESKFKNKKISPRTHVKSAEKYKTWQFDKSHLTIVPPLPKVEPKKETDKKLKEQEPNKTDRNNEDT